MKEKTPICLLCRAAVSTGKDTPLRHETICNHSITVTFYTLYSSLQQPHCNSESKTTRALLTFPIFDTRCTDKGGRAYHIWCGQKAIMNINGTKDRQGHEDGTRALHGAGHAQKPRPGLARPAAGLGPGNKDCFRVRAGPR